VRADLQMLDFRKAHHLTRKPSRPVERITGVQKPDFMCDVYCCDAAGCCTVVEKGVPCSCETGCFAEVTGSTPTALSTFICSGTTPDLALTASRQLAGSLQCTSVEFRAAASAYCTNDYEPDKICISSATAVQPTALLVLLFLHFVSQLMART
jgi:hypothetical protein